MWEEGDNTLISWFSFTDVFWVAFSCNLKQPDDYTVNRVNFSHCFLHWKWVPRCILLCASLQPCSGEGRKYTEQMIAMCSVSENSLEWFPQLTHTVYFSSSTLWMLSLKKKKKKTFWKNYSQVLSQRPQCREPPSREIRNCIWQDVVFGGSVGDSTCSIERRQAEQANTVSPRDLMDNKWHTAKMFWVEFIQVRVCRYKQTRGGNTLNYSGHAELTSCHPHLACTRPFGT